LILERDDEVEDFALSNFIKNFWHDTSLQCWNVFLTNPVISRPSPR
jgi:hypothetical protein